MILGATAAVAQPVIGDELARALPSTYPSKLAALEGLFVTQRGAKLSIGGLPDVATRTTPLAIRIPDALSLLATHDPNGEVVGLNDVPRDQWPPTLVSHVAFQLMVGAATLMLGVGAAFWWAWRRSRWTGLERAPLAAAWSSRRPSVFWHWRPAGS
jgi:cytochrome d ubiquinol oxidase subunit I